MNSESKKTKNKAYSTMILGFFLCFFMVGVYIVTNNISKSYALPIDLDAVDIENITTQTRQVGMDTNGNIKYDAEYTSDGEGLTEKGYTPYFYQPETGFYSLGTKFVGSVAVGENAGTVYDIDMFCLESTKTIPYVGQNYSRNSDSDKLIDEGIIYIINKAYENAEFENNQLTLDMPDYYNAQIAIWIYQELNKTVPFDWCQIPEGQGECERPAYLITNPDGPESQAFQRKVGTLTDLKNTWNAVKDDSSNPITNYVNNALAVKNDTTENAIKVTSGDVELTLTEDKKYYETNLIEVAVTTAANTTFSGFNFVLNDQEVAATVVDENGETISDYSTLANKKFKIRISADSVREGATTKISGDFTGRFEKTAYLAYGLVGENGDVSGNYQKALLAQSTTTLKTVPLKLEISVPDTGVDYSQYIYIIGAMVLVIGLTVIYVNTKSKEI